MSNIKDVYIEARAPWTWASARNEFDPQGISVEDSAFLASLFLNPVIGLQLSQTDDGYDDNAGGGRTSMYSITIEGQEALAFPAIERLVNILEGAGGTVTSAEAYDIEDGHDRVVYR